MLNKTKVEVEIKDNAYSNRYEKALELLQIYKKQYMDKSNIHDNKFFFGTMGNLHTAMGHTKLGVEYAKKAMRFFNDEDSMFVNIWSLAYCYSQIHYLRNKAVHMYHKCLSFYDKRMKQYSSMSQEYNKYLEKFADVLHNLSFAEENLEGIEESIEIYRKVNGKSLIDKIDNAYESVFIIQLNARELKKCRRTINKIISPELKNELRKLLLNQANYIRLVS